MVKNEIKFAHLADAHLNGWRYETLKNKNFNYFKEIIEDLLNKNLDFVIFSGDLFDNPQPSINLANKVIELLKKFKEKNIPLYFIGGSHDYSSIGESFIDLFDKIDLIKNVNQIKKESETKYTIFPTINEDLKICIYGVSGKKKELDKNIIKNLKLSQKLDEEYFNIFMFHTSITELLPSQFDYLKKDAISKTILPKNFNYYAGGHIHIFSKASYEKGFITYPGPIFPNNFMELHSVNPSYILGTYNFDTKRLELKKVEKPINNLIYLNIKSNNIDSTKLNQMILEKLSKEDLNDKIVLLELSGDLDDQLKNLQMSKIADFIYDEGAEIFLKNTYKLKSKINKEFSDIEKNLDVQELEERIFNETFKEEKDELKKKEFKKLFNKILSDDFYKKDEERNEDYKNRITNIFKKIFEEKN